MLQRSVSSLLLRSASRKAQGFLSCSIPSSTHLSTVSFQSCPHCSAAYCCCSSFLASSTSSFINTRKYFSSSSTSASTSASETDQTHDDFKPVHKGSGIPTSPASSSSSSSSSSTSASSVRPLQPLREDMSDAELTSLISSDVSSNGVFLYMKGSPSVPRCGFSGNVCRILHHLNVNFQSRDVLQHDGLREAVKKFSDWPTLPQLYVDGEFVGGSDIVSQLFKSGELQKLVAKHVKQS